MKILSRIKISSTLQSSINKEDNIKASGISSKSNKDVIKKSDDPRCLLNVIDTKIPRNKKCPVTNMKYKQCCGKL